MLPYYDYCAIIVLQLEHMFERMNEMAQIVPIKELKNTAKISELCHSSDEPVYITKNGYGDMVIMSIELYENTMQNSDGNKPPTIKHRTQKADSNADFDDYELEKQLNRLRLTAAKTKAKFSDAR